MLGTIQKYQKHFIIVDENSCHIKENDKVFIPLYDEVAIIKDATSYEFELKLVGKMGHYNRNTCKKIIAQSTGLNIEGVPYVSLTNGYTLNLHKEGDGIIRIYNNEGHIYCMYPYHLTNTAYKHLAILNNVLPSDKFTEEQFKLLWLGVKYNCEDHCNCPHEKCSKADKYLYSITTVTEVDIKSTWVCTNYNGDHKGKDCNCKTGLIQEPITHIKDGHTFVSINSSQQYVLADM